MLCNPFLAAADNRVTDLARAGQHGERLLADMMPIQHVDSRDLHRLLGANEARNQKQRQIVPCHSTARHDQSLTFTRDHESSIRMHLYVRVVLRQSVAIGPMCGRLYPIQQPGLCE